MDKSNPDLSSDKNLRAVQLLLGHTKLESTVRYLGIDVDDALEISEQIEI
jgi:site-specific recombinase XerC